MKVPYVWASKRSAPRKARGFTLIELLIVILILAILMSVAMPLYLGAVADAQLKVCRANMQTIANAEVAYRTSNTAHSFTTVLTDLASNLGAVPVCPSGGTYSVQVSNGTLTAQNGTVVPAGMLVISCSYAGHGKFAPGIDGY